MSEQKPPVATGNAAAILAQAAAKKAESGTDLAVAGDKQGSQELLTGVEYPRYQLPISPCSIDFGTHRRAYPDGVAQADNDAEEAVLRQMAAVGNIHVLGDIAEKPKFAQPPR